MWSALLKIYGSVTVMDHVVLFVTDGVVLCQWIQLFTEWRWEELKSKLQNPLWKNLIVNLYLINHIIYHIHTCIN